MIVDFLKSMQEAYRSMFDKKDQELRSINTEIAEASKFLDLLQSESESSFTQFTPRNVTNKNSKKIDELSAGLAQLNLRKESVQKELDDIHGWLNDIDTCLEEVSITSTKVPTRDVQINKEEISSVTIGKASDLMESSSETEDSSVTDTILEDTSVCNSGESISISRSDILRIANYLPADPMRARIELFELAKRFD